MRYNVDTAHRKLTLWALEDIPVDDWSERWPERTYAMLVGVLCDEHATDEEIYVASRLLCRERRVDDRWAKERLSVVQRDDIDERTRARASIPLGLLLTTAHVEGFDDDDPWVEEAVFEHVRKALYDIYADRHAHSLVRRRALEALGHAPGTWLHDAIRAAYAGDDDWRVTALRCMFHDDGFEQEILESLASDNVHVRSAAIRAAGAAAACGEFEGAWPCIHTVLSEPSSAHRPLLLAAIEAVGHVRPEAAEDLLADLVSSTDEDVARAAGRTLAFVRLPLSQIDAKERCKRGDRFIFVRK